jgi:hypothetical protein
MDIVFCLIGKFLMTLIELYFTRRKIFLIFLMIDHGDFVECYRKRRRVDRSVDH